ncbi:MAG TPA: hypothetical protein VIE43_24770 [Thermoanaerobaculia bacterium]|jgi:hypothetical protein|nr:hypothetical protein [Thermoanaerobaculia bacterium]
MKKQTKPIAKLTLSRETLDRLELKGVQGGRATNINQIVETDTPSECFC